MFKLSFIEGENIASVYKRESNNDPVFVGNLKILEEKDEFSNASYDDQLLRDLISKYKLDKKDKKNLETLLNKKIKSKNEPSANFLDKYLKNKSTELVLPTGYFLKQIHVNEPGSKRKTMYIPAKSNSGKTTWIAEYLDSYMEQYPDDDIMLFSGVPKDEPALQRFGDKIIRADLSSFRDEPITEMEELEDLTDTFCIFDDVNSIPDLKTKKSIISLRDMILQNGRHTNTSCMCTSHNALDNRLTAYPIKESDMFVLFPSRNKQQTESLLSRYGGLNREQIKKILGLKTRWVEMNKNVPEYIVYQTGAYLL
jgi:hypothetical protein